MADAAEAPYAFNNTGSARKAFVPSTSDTVDLPFVTRALFVGGAGNVRVLMASDTDPVTITGIAAGSLLPISVRRIYTTSLTATNLLALY